MRKSVGLSEVIFAALCLIGVGLHTSSAWIPGWMGLQGLLVIAGWLVGGLCPAQNATATEPSPSSVTLSNTLKIFFTQSMARVWPWYFALIAIFALSATLGRGPSGFAERWPYLVSFTFNLPRISSNWTYSPIYGQLWIFSAMLQLAVLTILLRKPLDKHPGRVLALVIVATMGLRYGFAILLLRLNPSAYYVGDTILWYAPLHLDAAVLGYLGHRICADARYPALLPKWLWCLLMSLSFGGLYAFGCHTDFPLFGNRAMAWGYPVLNLLLLTSLLALKRLVTVPISAQPFLAALFLVYALKPLIKEQVVTWRLRNLDFYSIWVELAFTGILLILAYTAVRLLLVRGKRQPKAYLILMMGLASLWSLAYIIRTSFVVEGERVFILWDDAMISMTYAKNLAHHQSLVWYEGATPLQGFSNLGVTLLMSLVHLLPIEGFKTSLVIQLIWALCTLVAVDMTARLTARLAPDDRYAPLLSAIALILFAPFFLWNLQGADTALTSLFAILMIYELTVLGDLKASPDRWRYIRLAAYALLGILARMDTALFAGLSIAFLIWYRQFKRAGMLAILCATLMGGILIFNHIYYDDWMPNTFYLKAAQNLPNEKIKFLLNYWVTSFAHLSPALGLAGYGLWSIAREQRRKAYPAALFALMTLAYNLWLGGDWSPQYESRFIMPAYPPLIALAIVGLLRLAKTYAPTEAIRAIVLFASVLALPLFMTPSGSTLEEWLVWSKATMYRGDNISNTKRGLIYRDLTTRDTLIGVHWAGTTAYFAERPMLDFLGKCDRHIAHTVGRMYWPGHSKWDWEYVLARKPDIISDTSRDLESNEEFLADYKALTYNGIQMFVRKGQEHKVFLVTETIEPPTPAKAH